MSKASKVGAAIDFIDETGFRLQTVNRQTWAPRGCTPVQRAWDRYDRLSVINAVTLSPTRRQIGLPFQIHEENIRTATAVAFVKQLRRQLRRPLIVVWDRWLVHRSAAKPKYFLCLEMTSLEHDCPTPSKSRASAARSDAAWRT